MAPASLRAPDMEVLHLIYDDLRNPWVGGGGAVRTQEIYSRMPPSVRVSLVTGAYPGIPAKRGRIRIYSGRPTNSYAWSRLTYYFSCLRMLSTKRFDVVVEDVGASIPTFRQLFSKKSHVLSVQVILGDSFVSKRGPIGYVLAYLQRLAIRAGRNFIVPSKFVADYIRKLNPRARVVVVPNGVLLPAKIHLRGKYFLYLGRIDIHGKGLDVLLDAMSTVRSARLVIAGGGEQSERTLLQMMIRKRGLSNRVKCLPRISGSKKQRIIASSLAICLPSRSETSSIVLLEGMAYGKSFVASNIPVLRAIAQESSAGITFRDGDAADLAVSLQRILSSDLRTYALRGREYAERHSWERISTDYLSAVRYLVRA